MLEFADDEFLPAFLVRAFEIALHLREFLRRGVLEGIDRLLFVADGEHGALYAARAGAGGEFGGEPAHDLPLLVAGVLRLVDQHVIDAEIELEMHPGRVDIGEKLQRLVDQVIVIEQAAALLLFGVARDDRMRDGQQRGAAIPQGRRRDGVQAMSQTRSCSSSRRCANAGIADGFRMMDLRGVRPLLTLVQKISR